jgi:nicotinamidase-related amidase
MTLTTIDPKTALIVVDLQQGVVGMTTAHPTAGVVANSAELARAFRSRGLPVVLVNATGGAPGRAEQQRAAGFVRPDGWADLVPELDAQPDDIYISKQTWGAFHNTALDESLRAAGVTQVVITGVATSAGVESTARAAHEHGYNVTLVTDAMTDMSAEAHDNSVALIFPRLGETGTTGEVLALLAE